LLSDLEPLEWPESLKEMQRNWIGKSVGAEVDFDIDPASIPPAGKNPDEEEPGVTVYTTRPDTLYGATYMVLSPEHPLVPRITSAQNRPAVDAYRAAVANKSDRDRTAETKDKTGVFTGAYAVNPVNDEKIPIWIADYVLMGYGTGAIMAVPAHDQRDYEFATKFKLPMRTVVKPADGSIPPTGRALEGDGIAVNSLSIDGLPTAEAKEQMIHILEAEGTGRGAVKYKLRDWIFSRQRYWGEPFPIILDTEGNAWAVPEADLPVTLPEMEDFKPTGTLEPPLSKAKEWASVNLDGKPAIRETNTMPQWAGSCWYFLRFIDPHNPRRFVDPEKEKYWMPVDLYVGGAEHAVLHLLYSRFWHKVLFDLEYVSGPEPFRKLVNQGTILGEAEFTLFETADKRPVNSADVEMVELGGEGGVESKIKSTGEKVFARRIEESEVERTKTGWALKSNPSIQVDSRSFKMSKSRGNVVNPDQIVADYGADTFRLYEMYLGPLEAQKPWNTRDIVGMSRFLNAVHRHLVGDEETNKTAKITPAEIADSLSRQMHRTIKKVAEDIEGLRFNTAIAELIKLNNEIGRLADGVPRELAENFTLMLAPFAPHLAEEIWSRLGHDESLARQPWPKFDPKMLVESMMELPIQVNGKLRGTISVAADAGQDQILQAAKTLPGVKTWLEGKTVVKEIYIEKKLVSFVVK